MRNRRIVAVKRSPPGKRREKGGFPVGREEGRGGSDDRVDLGFCEEREKRGGVFAERGRDN